MSEKKYVHVFKFNVHHDKVKYERGQECPADILPAMKQQGLVEKVAAGFEMAPAEPKPGRVGDPGTVRADTPLDAEIPEVNDGAELEKEGDEDEADEASELEAPAPKASSPKSAPRPKAGNVRAAKPAPALTPVPEAAPKTDEQAS